MTHDHDMAPATEAVRQGYEPATISVKGLLVCLAVLVVMAVVIQSGVWGLLKVYLAQPRGVDAPQSAIRGQNQFTSPELQPVQAHNQLPWEDLADLRKKEAAQFQQMGWTMDATGAAVIPPDVLEGLAHKYHGAGGGVPVPGQGWPGTQPSQSVSSPSAATRPVGGGRS